MSDPEATTSPRRRAAVVAAAVAAAALLAIAVGVALSVRNTLDKIPRVDDAVLSTIPPSQESFATDPPPASTAPPASDASGGTASAAAPEETTTAYPYTVIDPDSIRWEDVEAIESADLVNVMLVGQDRRAGEERTRSDTMILFSLNPRTGEIALISFLRDLYVRIPGGYADNRLNNAYWYGGFPLLYETLNVNFGVSVDRGIEVDFDGFTALIDLIGGVDVTLTAAEASVVGGGAAEGVCHLNGRQALAFSRIRKLDNDFNRTGRQRAVLEAVFQKLREADLATLLKLLDAALPMITTDMTDSELMSLAVKLASLSGELQIRGHLIPASDSYRFARIREMEVLLPDAARIQRHLQEDYLPFDR